MNIVENYNYTLLSQLPSAPTAYIKNNGGSSRWSFKKPKTQNYTHGPATHLEFDKNEQLLVTFGRRVMSINMKRADNLEKDRVIGDFVETGVVSATYRKDYKLLAVGEGSSTIRLITSENRMTVRKLHGHEGAIQCLLFTHDSRRLISGANDGTVRLWDVDSGEQTMIIGGHTDQVRAIALCDDNNRVLSGSYDHSIKLWDIAAEECLHTFDHGAPVESLLVLGGGALAVSAGGTFIKIWDLLSGRMVYKGDNHSKTVTSLYLNKKGTKFITGSLDCMAKVYSTTTYNVVSSIKFPEPILSLTMNDDRLFVGSTTGNLHIATRVNAAPVVVKSHDDEGKKKKKIGNQIRAKIDEKNAPSTAITTADQLQYVKLDRFLKAFQHRAAFDYAINVMKSVDAIARVVYELTRRNTLYPVLVDRTELELVEIMHTIRRFNGNLRYINIGVTLMDSLLSIYKSQLLNGECKALFHSIKNDIHKQCSRQNALLKISGALQLLYLAQDNHQHQIQDDLEEILKEEKDNNDENEKEDEVEEEEEVKEKIVEKENINGKKENNNNNNNNNNKSKTSTTNGIDKKNINNNNNNNTKPINNNNNKTNKNNTTTTTTTTTTTNKPNGTVKKPTTTTIPKPTQPTTTTTTVEKKRKSSEESEHIEQPKETTTTKQPEKKQKPSLTAPTLSMMNKQVKKPASTKSK